jgi:lysylphosphatidylglycerol synthetase-like protein (DUF2156 family)
MKLLGGEGSGVAEKRDNESRGNRENAVEPKRHRTRLVSIVAFLLALETAGFLSLALLQWLRGDLFERVSIPGIGPSPFILIFSFLAVLAFLGTVGFYRLWPAAWITAVSVQGISLILSLLLYANQRPAYIYWIMIFCIVLVAYLNHSEVKSAFRTGPPGNDGGKSDE